MTQKLIRLFVWLVLLGLIGMTLSPIAARPESGLPVNLERALAFAAAGFLVKLAYPRRFLTAAVLLLVFIVGLEAMQHLTPDRHGHTLDALWKCAGAFAGMAAGALIIGANKLRSRLKAA
ncbi:MAG: VanZ family protein [Pseudorhizobium sp.]